MNQPIMNALDAVAGSQASAYITMADGNRYCFMQLYSFESNMEINVAEVPILGKSGKGNKPTGWTGTWSGTAHYNQSVALAGRRKRLIYQAFQSLCLFI